jgi:hypothetical protein
VIIDNLGVESDVDRDQCDEAFGVHQDGKEARVQPLFSEGTLLLQNKLIQSFTCNQRSSAHRMANNHQLPTTSTASTLNGGIRTSSATPTLVVVTGVAAAAAVAAVVVD